MREGLPGVVAVPAGHERGGDADEHEEGAHAEDVEDVVVPDVGGDEGLAPAFGDKVEEGIGGGEDVLGESGEGGGGAYGRGVVGEGWRDDLEGCEGVVADEVVGNLVFASTNAWGRGC